MAAFYPIMQQILFGMPGSPIPSATTTLAQIDSPPHSSSFSSASSSSSSSTGTPTSTSSATPGPGISGLSPLIAHFLSMSALTDWLKLIVIGSFFETCRRFAYMLYNKILNSFYIRLHFTEDDPSYMWILVWLSKQPSWSKSRDVQISAGSYGLDSAAVVLDGEDDLGNQIWKSSRKLSYLPSLTANYSLWYKGCYMTVMRDQRETGYYGRAESTLHISILSRRHSILTELLQEARKYYMAAQEHSMCVYVSDTSNNWKHIACRAKRSLHSIVLDPGVKDMLINDARDFLLSKSWYAERGIPFRRGYLLYGAPGSGKTSIIHSMAGELCLDVYIISLSRAGLDDSALSELVNALPERCVALMEDIDAAFTHALNREGADGTDGAGKNGGTTGGAVGAVGGTGTSGGPSGAPPSTSRLSLSGLLNALDGVGAQEGRILFATTNKYSALDPALCRPGRMDLHVEFKLASRYQAKELFKRFYFPTQLHDGTEDNEEEKGKETDEMNDEEEEEQKEKDSIAGDSGYSGSGAPTPEGSRTPPSDDILVGTTTTAGKEVEIKPKTAAEIQKLMAGAGNINELHALPPRMSLKVVEALAERFADGIPERECSMASLQGYLMTYKTRPEEAVRDLGEWVIKEREAKLKKESDAKKKEELDKKKAEEDKKKKEEEEEKEKKKKEEEEAELKKKTASASTAACVHCKCGGAATATSAATTPKVDEVVA